MAKDIADHGLDPTSLICVYKRTRDAKQYVVAEGNRRVTALKLLTNPDVILGLTTPTRAKEIKRLSDSFDVPDYIHCAVFPNELEAEHWIELKHTGQHGGAGTVPWGSVETLRFTHRNKTMPAELQLIDFATTNLPDFDLNAIRITNLERLISDPSVRNALGIHIIDSIIYVTISPVDFISVLSVFFAEMSKDGFTVNSIKTKVDRYIFIQNFLVNCKILNLDHDPDGEKLFQLSGGARFIPQHSNQKAAKSAVRTSLHKGILNLVVTDSRYSSTVRALSKELKDYGFEKSPIGAIYLIQAFLERFISETLTNPDNDRSKNSLKNLLNLAMESKLPDASESIKRSIDILCQSPIISKKQFENMLNMTRLHRIEYMNSIVDAMSILVKNLHHFSRAAQESIT